MPILSPQRLCRVLRVPGSPRRRETPRTRAAFFSMETASTQKEMAAMVGLSREQDRPGRTRGKEAAAPRGGGLASAALGPARGARPALPPAPPYILMVPLDPRLVLSTSCRPRAALTLTASAACARATSVLGFTVFAAATAAAEEKSHAARGKLRAGAPWPGGTMRFFRKSWRARPAPSVPARCRHWATARAAHAHWFAAAWCLRSHPSRRRRDLDVIAQGSNRFPAVSATRFRRCGSVGHSFADPGVQGAGGACAPRGAGRMVGLLPPLLARFAPQSPSLAAFMAFFGAFWTLCLTVLQVPWGHTS